MKLFLHKDDDESEWYFSLVPFEELEPESNLVAVDASTNETINCVYQELQETEL